MNIALNVFGQFEFSFFMVNSVCLYLCIGVLPYGKLRGTKENLVLGRLLLIIAPKVSTYCAHYPSLSLSPPPTPLYAMLTEEEGRRP